uniref:Dynein, light chain, roadblock-type 1 n=1 Tax=Cyprinus carpio carpio TaxID=630221 RepID=A0A9J8C176_CYPCA
LLNVLICACNLKYIFISLLLSRLRFLWANFDCRALSCKRWHLVTSYCACKYNKQNQKYVYFFRRQAEVEETIKRIQSQKGVQGIIIVNAEGIPIKSTLDNSSTVQYAGNVHQLLMKARGMVRDIDPQNDLTFLRVRSKKNEIMIAPDKDYFLIVIQNPTE